VTARPARDSPDCLSATLPGVRGAGIPYRGGLGSATGGALSGPGRT
jgi:hypothetical protein